MNICNHAELRTASAGQPIHAWSLRSACFPRCICSGSAGNGYKGKWEIISYNPPYLTHKKLISSINQPQVISCGG